VVVDPFAEQLVVARAVEGAWRERAFARGDEEGTSGVAAAVGGDDVPVVFADEVLDLFFEPDIGAELEALVDEVGGEVACEDAREAADVIHVFFGIERGELAAELRQRIDDAAGCAAQARVERCEEAGGPTADDGDVSGIRNHACHATSCGGGS
jgi:hypothetical protein